MPNVFRSCQLPWRIWPWGLALSHSDTDVAPECTVEFGGMFVQPTPPYRRLWIKTRFASSAYAMAKPRRDNENLSDVTGYDIVAHRELFTPQTRERDETAWLETGICPDPGFYYSTDSDWLDGVRQHWAERQLTSETPFSAVHFLLDGRDGYIEIAAAGFNWWAWTEGNPILSNVKGEPVLSGTWEIDTQC